MNDYEIRRVQNTILDILFQVNRDVQAFISRLDESYNANTLPDVLEAMARIEDIPSVHEPIRLTLEHYLNSRSTWIRDGAINGLSYLDDVKSLDALQQTLSNETSDHLRDYLTRVIERLGD